MICIQCGELQEAAVCFACSPIASEARRQVRVTIAHERRNLVRGSRRRMARTLRAIASLQAEAA